MTRPKLARLVQTTELDYVHHFQELAKLHLVMEEVGPDPTLLTTRAILETDLGNFDAARRSAQAAIDLDPWCAEAHYQKGLACVMSAFVRADVLPAGPGTHASPHETSRDLLREAQGAFGHAVRLNPDDEDALDDLAAISWALSTSADEETLGALLRRSCSE